MVLRNGQKRGGRRSFQVRVDRRARPQRISLRARYSAVDRAADQTLARFRV